MHLAITKVAPTKVRNGAETARYSEKVASGPNP
jgi:hypothetical protein